MPKLMGDTLGIHPLLIFGSLLVGSRVAGVAGAIFGMPVAAIIWAMLVLWLNRSRFGRLAQARQEAREARPPIPRPDRRFRVLGNVWAQVNARLAGRRADAQSTSHVRPD